MNASPWRPQPYQPDGGFNLEGLPLLAGALIGAAVGLGWLISFIGQWFYAVIVFPVLVGTALMVVGKEMARITKMRNQLRAIVKCCVLRKSESGGIFLQHSIYKFPSLEKKNQLLRSVEPAPSLFRCLGQFEHHGQARFPGAVAFRTAVT